MNASWRFADCANAIKGDLVRRGAFTPAHICENTRFPQSTLVSPTRLADRASMRGSVTLDAVRVFKTARSYGGEAPLQSGKCVYDADLIGHAMTASLDLFCFESAKGAVLLETPSVTNRTEV
jgi:hypothetical protein